MTAISEPASPKSPRKRLGRGLVSLVSTPVRIALPAHHSSAQAGKETASLDVGGTPENTARDGASAHRHAPFEADDRGGTMQLLPLTSIHPNPHQPRQQFDEDNLKALAASIAKSGMMQPIVVRPDRQGGFQIIAGERRWRASQMLGLPRIHAVVRDVDDRLAAQFSLVENLQREDLNPIERAEAFQRLIDEFGLMHQEIAESVGWDRSSVTNHLRLNDLDDFSKDAVRAGRLSMGHARALLGITNLARRRALAGQAVNAAWSVRELERRVKAMGEEDSAASSTENPAKTAGVHPHMADLQKRLSAHLGTKVYLRPGRTKGSGKLIIEFYNLDQFEGLMNRLAFATE